ncbi:MAG TPA: hypothetical protein DIC42_01585 [Holosporales bacterium]|nr:hypothetical protein [Holosporales bacterium]
MKKQRYICKIFRFYLVIYWIFYPVFLQALEIRQLNDLQKITDTDTHFVLEELNGLSENEWNQVWKKLSEVQTEERDIVFRTTGMVSKDALSDFQKLRLTNHGHLDIKLHKDDQGSVLFQAKQLDNFGELSFESEHQHHKLILKQHSIGRSLFRSRFGDLACWYLHPTEGFFETLGNITVQALEPLDPKFQFLASIKTNSVTFKDIANLGGRVSAKKNISAVFTNEASQVNLFGSFFAEECLTVQSIFNLNILDKAELQAKKELRFTCRNQMTLEAGSLVRSAMCYLVANGGLTGEGAIDGYGVKIISDRLIEANQLKFGKALHILEMSGSIVEASQNLSPLKSLIVRGTSSVKKGEFSWKVGELMRVDTGNGADLQGSFESDNYLNINILSRYDFNPNRLSLKARTLHLKADSSLTIDAVKIVANTLALETSNKDKKLSLTGLPKPFDQNLEKMRLYMIGGIQTSNQMGTNWSRQYHWGFKGKSLRLTGYHRLDFAGIDVDDYCVGPKLGIGTVQVKARVNQNYDAKFNKLKNDATLSVDSEWSVFNNISTNIASIFLSGTQTSLKNVNAGQTHLTSNCERTQTAGHNVLGALHFGELAKYVKMCGVTEVKGNQKTFQFNGREFLTDSKRSLVFQNPLDEVFLRADRIDFKPNLKANKTTLEATVLNHVDPEQFEGGELTVKADVYEDGVERLIQMIDRCQNVKKARMIMLTTDWRNTTERHFQHPDLTLAFNSIYSSASIDAKRDLCLIGVTGVEIETLYEVVRKYYHASDILGFSETSGSRDSAHFKRVVINADGHLVIAAEDGEARFKGAVLQAKELDIFAKSVVLGSVVAQLESFEHKERWWGLAKETIRKVYEVACATQLRGVRGSIRATKAKLVGKGAQFAFSQLALHGEKGIELRGQLLHAETDIEKARLVLNFFGLDIIDPFDEGIPVISPSISWGFKTTRSLINEAFHLMGSVAANSLSVSTGESASADFRGSHVNVQDLEAETNNLLFGGAERSRSCELTSNTITQGVAFMPIFPFFGPTASYRMNKQRNTCRGWDSGNVCIGHLHNKLSDMKFYANNVFGGIFRNSGKDFSVLVDHKQTIESQDGWSSSVGIGYETLSLGFGMNGGEKRSSEGTDFHTPPGLFRSDIRYPDFDNRWGFNFDVTLSFNPSKLGGGFGFQAGDYNFSVHSSMVTAFIGGGNTTGFFGNLSKYSAMVGASAKIGVNFVNAMGLADVLDQETVAFFNRAGHIISAVDGNIQGACSIGNVCQGWKEHCKKAAEAKSILEANNFLDEENVLIDVESVKEEQESRKIESMELLIDPTKQLEGEKTAVGKGKPNDFLVWFSKQIERENTKKVNNIGYLNTKQRDPAFDQLIKAGIAFGGRINDLEERYPTIANVMNLVVSGMALCRVGSLLVGASSSVVMPIALGIYVTYEGSQFIYNYVKNNYGHENAQSLMRSLYFLGEMTSAVNMGKKIPNNLISKLLNDCVIKQKLAPYELGSGKSIAERLFGNNFNKPLSEWLYIIKINGRNPVNSKYAGKIFYFNQQWVAKNLKGVTDPVKIRIIKSLAERFPLGVPFNRNGFPDFSRYAVKKVRIPFSGNSKTDIRLGEKVLGKTPEGKVLHHHCDGKTMILIDETIHNAIRHTGGDAITRYLNESGKITIWSK